MRGSECVAIASAASRKSVAIAISMRLALGWRTLGVFHSLHPHLFSRAFDERVLARGIDRGSREWALAVARAAEEHGCAAVLPVDFVDFVTLSRYSRVFKDLGIALVAPRYEKLVEVSDKRNLPKILRGLAETPRQVEVSSPRDLELVKALRPPLVVKGFSDAARPRYFARVEDAAREASRRAPCLVQELVVGIGRGYYAACAEGRPLLEFTHQRIVEYEPSGGPSLAARGPVEDPRLFAMGRAIVERIQWSGPLMVETKYVAHEDRYVVIELNPKFWGSIDLPISLGFYFPPVLVMAWLHGAERARSFARSLLVRSGCFSWVLDGARYLVKDLPTWIRLVELSMRCLGSDADPRDLAKCLAQLWFAAQRFRRERVSWTSYVEDCVANAEALIRRALRAKAIALILDLDGTLVELDVNWSRVREELCRELGMPRAASVMGFLNRLYREIPRLYERASRIVESFEIEAAENPRPLLPIDTLKALAKALRARICVATKQSRRAAEKALRAIGLEGAELATRDECGPSKESLYMLCLERTGAESGIAIDDAIDGVVAAIRLGMLPIAVARNSYTAWKVRRLGALAIHVKHLPKLLKKLANTLATKHR